MTITIEHFGGRVELEGEAEISEVLALRYGEGFNEFWISGAAQFPNVSLVVGTRGAALHYFPEEGHPGFRSVGNDSKTGSAAFRTNTPEEYLMVSASSVVPTPHAVAAVLAFARSSEIPPGIEWEEL